MVEDLAEDLTHGMRLDFLQLFPQVESLALARGDLALLGWSEIRRLLVGNFHYWQRSGLGGSWVGG